MRHVTFYHAKTGLLNGTSLLVSDDNAVGLNTPADHIAIDHPPDRQLDHLCEQMDLATGGIVEYQPPQPSADHEWHAETRRWRLSADAAAKEARRGDALRQIAAMDQVERHLVRQLVLAATSGPQIAPVAKARAELQAIDDQIAALQQHL